MNVKSYNNQDLLDVLVVLRRIIHASDLHSKYVMKISGLTVPQLVVLRAIDDLGAVTVRQISDHVSLSQATVSTILNRLEERTFIKRSRNCDDKRVVNTDLTGQGRSVLRDAPSLLDDQFAQRFEDLRPAERQDIMMSLQKMAKLMSPGDVDPRPPTHARSARQKAKNAPQKTAL
ncbi:MarR family transcriptional regulator [Thalassospira sp. MA62]|nr:MarR family transcriptional regulator [Thalassospira sp. MA62]